jgi:hypothetical protein
MRSQPLSLRVRARTGLPLGFPRIGFRNRHPHRREEHAVFAPLPPERKLAAILAADIEGYSRLMHEDEEATLATLSSHRAIIDSLITARRGHITGSAGDSVLAEFASIIDAVHCGVVISRLSRVRTPHCLPSAGWTSALGSISVMSCSKMATSSVMA